MVNAGAVADQESQCLLGNEADLEAHIAGLNQLVDDAEIHLFDRPLCIFATLFACSYLGAALLVIAPSLKPMQSSDPKGLSEGARTALQAVLDGSSSMAPRLFEKYAGFLGPALLEVAIEQRTVMHLRYLWERSVYDPSPADVQYIYGQGLSAECQLTALQADMTLTPAQHAVRLALFVFPQPFILLATPNAAFCRAMTKRMKKWLERSDLVALWAPSFLGLQSIEEMEKVLKGFYYHPLLFGVTAEKIWAEHELLMSSNGISH
ncbi:hypothetical protein PRZ48_009606 [Zasmidium cellare]|uniref:Uncharacterized protein n=1 Tax=Zasmidium cellare TaxID=395010 RepID=A0ABR0ECK4_ZASCE|nr:hypothetical protein PRZ48_009606 [Zasmidium cellare]